jgi:hypothetical protein
MIYNILHVCFIIIQYGFQSMDCESTIVISIMKMKKVTDFLKCNNISLILKMCVVIWRGKLLLNSISKKILLRFSVMLTMILLSLFCIIETMFIGSKLPYHAIWWKIELCKYQNSIMWFVWCSCKSHISKSLCLWLWDFDILINNN